MTTNYHDKNPHYRPGPRIPQFTAQMALANAALNARVKARREEAYELELVPLGGVQYVMPLCPAEAGNL